MPLPPGGGAGIKGRKKRWMVGGGYRTMVGIEMDEEVTATPSPPVFGRTTSRASESGATSLTLTRTRSSRYSHSGHSGPAAPSLTRTTTSTSKPAATTSDSTNALVPTFTSSHVLRLRLPLPLYAPFTAAQLVETLHKHYQYGKRVGRSTSTSLAPGTIEENAYSFARMVDKAPGPVDEATRLSKAHKLGRTTMEGAPAIGRVDERGGEDIQGQAGRKGFRYTMRKAVSKAVGAVQGEREDTVEDDRANWVTPFTG
ncbi:hypothetical protein QFC19_008055 [Naganishia cerealis]|uniref:Uncharacterized protein n=1 Tax=Naganishia cerealis TaxID=610337 RepID=A0ACC2V504_9TREE|nr:hypothetical protein QFC19_008055 [Naganishia cerealis]